MMRIDVHDVSRNLIGRGVVDSTSPSARLVDQSTGTSFSLNWTGALDEQGRLCRCPVCECRDLFRRKDAPQRLGLTLVILAALSSVVLFALDKVAMSILVLLGMVVLDFIIGRFMGQCLVCYRCRSEFRDTIIDQTIHKPWDLAVGEKYRQQGMMNQQASDDEGEET